MLRKTAVSQTQIQTLIATPQCHSVSNNTLMTKHTNNSNMCTISKVQSYQNIEIDLHVCITLQALILVRSGRRPHPSCTQYTTKHWSATSVKCSFLSQL